MNDPRERYLESALDELYRGGPESDLAERILRDDDPPALKVVAGDSGLRPRRWLWFWLQAACVVITLSVIALLMWPRDERLPETIAGSDAAFTTSGDEIDATGGWYLIETGSPVVKAGGGRIESVSGRVLMKVGEIPDDSELAAREDWLRQNGVNDMSKLNWVKTGGMAICLLVGTAVVDGQLLQAQKVEKPAKEDSRENDAEVAERAEKELKELRAELENTEKAVADRERELKAARDEGDTARIKALQSEVDELIMHATEVTRDIDRRELDRDMREVRVKIRDTEVQLESLSKRLDKNPDDETVRKEIADLKAAREELQVKLDELELRSAGEGDRPDPDALITVDFVQKGIHEAMHYIALRSGLQIVIEGDLDVKLTVMFNDAKPRDIIRAICKANNLVMIEDGDVIIIKKSSGETSTPDRDADPDKPISVEYEDMPLSLVLMDIAKRSGLDILNQLPKGEDPAVTLSLSKIKPRAIVELICDDLELRLLKRGEKLVVRQALSDMSQEELKNELEMTEMERRALENRLQFTEVAMEGAKEEGDKDAVARMKKEKEVLLDRLAEMDEEIKALEEVIED